MQVIGRIYKITSSETDVVYVGSTVLQLNNRFQIHKSHYKTYSNNKSHYITSFELCKYTDAKIELIHEGLFDSKKDMEQLEGEIIRTTPNAVNKCIPGRTIQECKKKYREEHRESIKEKAKQYRNDNKDIINEKAKQYREKKKKEVSHGESEPESDI